MGSLTLCLESNKLIKRVKDETLDYLQTFVTSRDSICQTQIYSTMDDLKNHRDKCRLCLKLLKTVKFSVTEDIQRKSQNLNIEVRSFHP